MNKEPNPTSHTEKEPAKPLLPRAPSDAQISTRRAYTGRVINLDVDKVRFPNGSEGELEIVRHRGASAVVPFMSDITSDDPQILLLKQYRYATGKYLWEIPAGVLGDGELPLECAHRELREETGCTAERVEFMTTIFTTPGFTDERIHLFMATGLSRGETAHEPDEFIELETMPLSKALTLIGDGTLCDAKSALAILFAAGFRAGK